MSTKTAVMIGAFVGSVIGGYIPTLFGASIFSFVSLVGSTIGAVIGIYAAFQISRM